MAWQKKKPVAAKVHRGCRIHEDRIEVCDNKGQPINTVAITSEPTTAELVRLIDADIIDVQWGDSWWRLSRAKPDGIVVGVESMAHETVKSRYGT